MPHYLAMATDGKLNQTMLLEIIACLLVAEDGNARGMHWQLPAYGVGRGGGR